MNRRTIRRSLGAALALVLAVGLAPTPVRAGWLDRIVRKAARVGEDVPIGKLGKLDDAADAARLAPSGRKALEAEGALDSAARITRARAVVREALGTAADPALLREVARLDGPLLEVSAAVAKGSRRVAETIPDVAARGRLLSVGGADTLVVLGRYGDLADDAVRFESAARGGKLLPAPGRSAVELQDFNRFFMTEGDRASTFWGKYVKPHWKVWLGGSALAAVMATPDEYIDQGGELTQAGIKKLGHGIATGIGAVVEGTIEAGAEVAKAPIKGAARGFASGFLADGWGLIALGGVAAAGVFFFWLSPIRRRLTSRRWSRA